MQGQGTWTPTGPDGGITPYADPHQVLEPSYCWNQSFCYEASGTNLLEGRDYFNNIPKPGYTPFLYPHYLASSGSGQQIDVPISHDFGNVIIGTSVIYDIPVRNGGNSTTTVSGVSYPPPAYSGPTDGFIIPGDLEATITKTMTFNPLTAGTFDGDVIFFSDGVGNGTMHVTGVGVAPPAPPAELNVIPMIILRR